jgi:hypothetical protein
MNDITLLAATSFFDSPIGGWVKAILGAVGVIIVIIAVLKAVGNFLNGKVGAGVKTIVMGLVVAAICIQPEIITNLINVMADVLNLGADSVEEIGGSAQ